MRIRFTLLLVIATVLLTSCATLDESKYKTPGKPITAEEIVNASPLADEAAAENLAQIDILEMTPEMIAFVEKSNDGLQNRYARMKRLVYAVMGEDNFELIYDEKTRTAAETFRDRRGNCLSFTNMFIAMSRHLDVQADYQEVDIPPDWSLAGDSFLFSQHVNVLVDLGVGERRVVDFNIYDFHVLYERRVISDARARAHYFSNIGVDLMLAGDTRLAYANFRQSIIEDSTFSPAWINVGILHRREGYPNYAEAAYKQALEIDQFNLIAMSNLANLYEQEERVELAELYRNKVETHRMNNPYYRFQLAQQAVIDGDYDAAIDHLKFAIKKREEEDRFYFLMGLSYRMKGDMEEASTWIARAEELAKDDVDRQRYHNKMDRLRSQGLVNQ
jgi:tetratricopeptide (TPR) repeat protein